MIEISADTIVRTRLCKTPGCDEEAENTHGRYAGLCSRHKRAAIEIDRASGAFAAAGAEKAGVIHRSASDGNLVATARELARQARRVERAQKQLDAERHELRKVYLRFGVEAGFLRGAR